MNNELQRKENESKLDYRVRVCSNKSTNSLTWEDVAELINASEETNYGESVFRKWWSSFEEGQEYEIKKKASTDDKLEELTIKKFEVQKERNKLQVEKLEVNRWIREQARAENINEKIEKAISKLKPVNIPNVESNKDKDKTKTAIIDIADAHYGREGKILGLKGEVLAEYSPEIFERRMWKLLDEAVEIIKKEDLEFVKVVNLGDQIDGMLRLSQLQFLELGVIESTMKVSEFLSQWLNKLSEYAEVDYYSVLGNHAELRISGLKSGEIKRENMELVIPWFIKERLKNNGRVTVHDAEFIQVIDVLGTNVCITHGQNEKNLENSIKDYSMIYQEQIHILKTGHLHHAHNKTIGMSGLQNIEFIQSPSIAGIDEFSVKLKKTANAGSLITVFEEDYGKKYVYDVRLK